MIDLSATAERHIDWWSVGYLTLGIVWCAALAFLPTTGMVSLNQKVGFFLGAFAATLFLPALIAGLVRGRKGDLRGFAKWFFWLAMFLAPLGLMNG